MMPTRALAFALLSVGWIGLAATSPGAQTPDVPLAATYSCDKALCVGVRSHARPFSFFAGPSAQTDATSGPLSARGYTGYLIRICDAVLQQMILEGDLAGNDDIGIFDIDRARSERNAGSNAEGDSRLDLLGQEFDILCDPATITNTRRNEFIVSAPLYLTGISALSPASFLPGDICRTLRLQPGAALIGVVDGTTAGDAGVEALVRSGAVPALNGELNNYLAGRPICKGAVQPAQLVKSFSTHPDAASAFCAPPPAPRVFYYLGDLEIITANAEAVRGCQFERVTQTYTNDRYAIFAKGDRDGSPEKALLLARFFAILSRMVVFSPSLLDKAFQDTFIGQSPSRKLEVFFWSIRGELR